MTTAALFSAALLADANEAVLTMDPVGYWPAREGSGEVIHDLSVHANHARSVHVLWDRDKELLGFTGAFQWLEIPKHKAYQTPAFSLGGWVWIRSEVIGGTWVNKKGFQLFGHAGDWMDRTGKGVRIGVRRQETIEVVSGGEEDVLGTWLYASHKDGKRVERAYGKPNLQLGAWHHILYTFKKGTGQLYHNGRLIASRDGIDYRPAEANLRIGNDASWWFQLAAKSGSLDGSVRDMVWFDRVISQEEVKRLAAATRPAVEPDVYGDHVVVLDGRPYSVADLGSLSLSTRQNVLELLNRKNKAALQKISGLLAPAATKALTVAGCRSAAVELLLKIEHDDAVLQALPQLVAVVEDETATSDVRADAALALAALGEEAGQAVPALAATLAALVSGEKVAFPRVEELLRNALTRALLDINPRHPQAKAVLGRTFFSAAVAKPSGSSGESFFSGKAVADQDYTATAYFKGATYKVGEGIAWKGVEKVPVAEYEAIVAVLAKKYPAARDWRDSDFEHLYRVPITKIGADGKTRKIYLEGPNFILDGSDAKCRAWSIFVDKLGYIHVMGGQHNTPNSKEYIPGSWEQLGLSRDRRSEGYPRQMYWVSTEPESIDSFTFVGQADNPRGIPVSYLNYMCLVQSPGGETYLYGRSDAYGWQCWGMFRYSADAQRWTTIGGDPYEVIASARRNNPGWMERLHDTIRGGHPTRPGKIRRLVWAWQPHFYNFCRDKWGVRFDPTGRMHVRMQISGLDGAGFVRPTAVYAWSDDRGESFHRADGSPVQLPLTVNPAPGHKAEIDTGKTLQHHDGDQYRTRQCLDLWLGLIKQAGYRI